MEICLKKKWDAQITAPLHNTEVLVDKSFIGRIKEIELLKNDILQKEQGSILISGHRGVGKTSFVYKVLQVVKEENNKDIKNKTLFIYINAGQLDNNGTGEAGQITTETILKTLIRRLYATAKDFFYKKPESNNAINDAADKQLRLEKLYKKAVAKEFKLNETMLNANTATTVNEKSTEAKISLDNLKLSVLAPALSFIAGMFMFIFEPADAKIIYKIISFALTLPLAISYTVSYKSSNKNENENQVKAEELYQLDNNLGNLEYDLEEFHRLLQQDNIKIIYIIDELDKLTEDQSQKVLRYLKNLFTLSKAIFIFIGNEDLYEKATAELIIEKGNSNSTNEITGIQPVKSNYRPESYTFFTSKYFISRPTINELKEYFFSRIDESVDKEKDYIQRAAHYLAYESKGDYFNLVNTIKDNIIKYNGDVPVVDIAVNSPVVIKKSRLHKSISVVFYQMYYSENFSRRRENELLHRQLIDYMYKLKEQIVADKIDDPDKADRQSSAIRDINRLLANTNFLYKVSESTLIINGVTMVINTYDYNGQFVTEPPDKVDVLSENEKRLVTLSEEYLNLLLPVINVLKYIEGESKITLEQLCNELPAILKNGAPGIDPVTSSTWPEIYFSLQQQQPLQDSGPEKIDIGNAELEDGIARIKTSAQIIFRELIIKWLIKNGYKQSLDVQPPIPVLNSAKTLTGIITDWNDFFYLLPEANHNFYNLLFGKLSQSVVNALDTSNKDKSRNNKPELLKPTIVFLFENPLSDLPELKQLVQKFADVNFINISSPENLQEEFEKTIKIITESNEEKIANEKKETISAASRPQIKPRVKK